MFAWVTCFFITEHSLFILILQAPSSKYSQQHHLCQSNSFTLLFIHCLSNTCEVSVTVEVEVDALENLRACLKKGTTKIFMYGFQRFYIIKCFILTDFSQTQ